MAAESRIVRPIRVYPTAHGKLVFGRRCLVMGVLNVTPDSFSDGGRFFEAAPPAASGVPLAACCRCHPAVARAEAMAAEGADVIEIGGESTRPGSKSVPDDEQIRRVVPVIRELRERRLSLPISVDTRSARVAAAALDAGADIINDVSAARYDAEMPRLLAERRVPFVIMHMLGTPETMQVDPHYHDVVREVGDFFIERAQALAAAGVQVDGRMIVDPGIGFGKTVEHNLALLRAAAAFGRSPLVTVPATSTGATGSLLPVPIERWPVLVGPSRKAFLGKLLNEPDPEKRLMGTAACVAHAVLTGVDMVRVHDVKAMRQVVDVCWGLRMRSAE